ncbi:N-acetylglucosamine kinase [Zophobihabitans entericus]|uniref:N-acetylglucosamine kinase n=1 Tax=Zophobihabitans entericus TaxID=1635327 RepID=A0A6G9IA22_9GAMM|nr:N-acetylglucosamine kinase [Zophobihabitans entericus]QIQ21066.1 N-acetylglucosamine kinase [Zophobihabitans entericus]
MLYGFDVGGTKIELAVFDKELKEVWRKRVPTPHQSYEAFLDIFVTLVNEADERFQCQGTIGIGVPGIVDIQNKTVFTTNIDIAKNKPFIWDLETRLKRNIEVNNDANCFALSEAFTPELQQYQQVLGVILGTGLGGGIVTQHKIVSGLNGCAGEIGHFKLPLDCLQILGYDIPVIACGCGQKGCCERYLSGTGFTWLYEHFYQVSEAAPDIIKLYYQGQPEAVEHVERYLELLAAYLANVLMIIDADLVVIGGGLSNFDEIYHQLPNRLTKYLLKVMKPPRIEKARYGDSGGARGAALLCLK